MNIKTEPPHILYTKEVSGVSRNKISIMKKTSTPQFKIVKRSTISETIEKTKICSM